MYLYLAFNLLALTCKVAMAYSLFLLQLANHGSIVVKAFLLYVRNLRIWGTEHLHQCTGGKGRVCPLSSLDLPLPRFIKRVETNSNTASFFKIWESYNVVALGKKKALKLNKNDSWELYNVCVNTSKIKVLCNFCSVICCGKMQLHYIQYHSFVFRYLVYRHKYTIVSL